MITLRGFVIYCAAFCLSLCAEPFHDSSSNDVPPVPDSQSADISPAQNVSEGSLSRWLTLDNLNFSIRYRNSMGTQGLRNFDSEQERSLVSGKVKLDREGKYSIGFRASSGRYFNWSYSNFSGTLFSTVVQQTLPTFSPALTGKFFFAVANGGGTSIPSSWGWNFYMRELYLSASPIKQVTLEFGGLGIEHGAATEMTTFDDDGFITGERIRIKDQRHLYVDEISSTFAYFGNLYTPNFFSRGDSLEKNNYRQIMVQKKWGKRLKSSASYDWLAGTHTFREATLVQVPESRVLEGVRLELYQRTNAIILPGDVSFGAGNGWSLTASQKLSKNRWRLEGGYADIDQNYVAYSGAAAAALFGFSLNGDSTQIGKRVLVRASYSPDPAVSLFSFFTHEVDTPQSPFWTSFNRQTWQLGLTLNFKNMLDRTSLLK